MKIYIYYLTVFFSFALSQNADITIAKVSVEGNVLSSQNTILFTSGLREGLKVSNTEFQRAVKRLWNLGLFEDVQLRLDSSSLENLSVSIIVKETPILSDILFEGNKKIKTKKILEELDFVKGQRIKPNTLHEISKKIKELYTEKGYLNTEVSSVLKSPKKESNIYEGKAKELVKDVKFIIEENKKVKIRKIIFEGNQAFSDFRLRWKMKEIKQQR